tara:strand:- start:64 stop:387 length:324 start_codon:yes stop_codon:yes gene_type:complete
MIGIIVIGILIVMTIILIKMNHFRHKIMIIALLVFILFLYSSISIVNKANEFDLKTTEGFFSAIKVYTGWLGNGFQNLKTITGNMIKMDWTSTNGTFLSKEQEQEIR